MNNGLFGFPSGVGLTPLSVSEFDASGSYIIPSRATSIAILAVGGGGGGGGGGRRASGTASFGGGGGGGGSIVYQEFRLESLDLKPGTTLLITIGAGGTAGAGAITDTTSGFPAGFGTNTTIGVTGKPGLLIVASGGNPGSGGSNISGTAGSASNRMIFGLTVSAGGGGGGGTNLGGTGVTITTPYINGGAGGGGVSTTPAVGSGGSISLPAFNTLNVTTVEYARSANILVGGSVNTATGPRHANTTVGGLLGRYSPGFGGAGGGGGQTTSANSGSNGYRGGGGGGGGGALNTIPTGSGGSGGNGYVVIWAY